MIDCGISVVVAAVSMCYSGGCEVRCGENVVRKRQNCGVEMAKIWCGNGGCDLRFRLKFIVLRRLGCSFRAFPTLISRISQNIPPFSHPFYSKSASYINISHLPKPQNPHSKRQNSR